MKNVGEFFRPLTVAQLPNPFSIKAAGRGEIAKGMGYVTGETKNDFVQIIWGTEGMGEISFYDRLFKIGRDDVFYYMPGECHRINAVTELFLCRWVCFDGPLAEAIMLAYRYPRFLPECGPCPDDLFDRIERNITDSDSFAQRMACADLLAVLAKMGCGNSFGFHSGQIVRRAMEFIRNNLSNPDLDVQMLCEQLDINRSTLTMLFQKRIGIPPGRQILNLRFSQARSLLSGTDLSIGEIAEKCGYRDISTFSRFVRRGTGFSPLEFRKNLESGAALSFRTNGKD